MRAQPLGGLVALQRAAGNRAVTAAVQRQVTFTKSGTNSDASGADTKDLRAVLIKHGSLLDRVPPHWKEQGEVRLSALRSALAALSKAPEDHGAVDLDTETDLVRLCELMISLATTGTSEAPAFSTRYPPMNAVVLTDKKAAKDICATLQDWRDYADQWVKDAAEELVRWEAGRKALGSAYYQPEHEDFRIRYKEFQKTHTEMKTASSMSDVLALHLAGAAGTALHEFGAVYRAGTLHAVVKWCDRSATEIYFIASNPYNLAPENQRSRVGGAAAAALALTLAQNKAHHGKFEEVRLMSANNKVKGLYDHYGFRVLSGDDLLTRPERERRRPDDSGAKPAKTEWHNMSDMALTPENAEKLWDRLAPETWLDLGVDGLGAGARPEGMPDRSGAG
ncbi:hypothetical protein SAMN05216553_110114 [Lentzea fradiae]|uniref:Uncharacterized protein n=1 Tax=Lentzea fradiae TaxID=200378 RepID=A0A1G7W2E6_9PSEU|nr:hypothetical protein [Lentzea fradiae]SDG66137.1 hypothetical protein SAMN05216553_110114 [Lentzea fradiae]